MDNIELLSKKTSDRIWEYLTRQFTGSGFEICVIWSPPLHYVWLATNSGHSASLPGEILLIGEPSLSPTSDDGFCRARIDAVYNGILIELQGVSLGSAPETATVVLVRTSAKEQTGLLANVKQIAWLWQVVQETAAIVNQQAYQLREQQAIVDHITDGLLVLDHDGIVKHLNAAAGRILNLVPSQSVGQRFSSLLDFEPIIAPIFESGLGYQDRELFIESPKRHLHLIDTAVPIKNSHGRVVSIVNSFREIQQVRKVADKFNGSHARYTFRDLIGRSDALRRVVDSAKKAARGFSNVMLLGESGVGKEVFAQAIHNASARADGPFVAINCAALPRDLIESELFGYASGSFTGASKEGRPGKFEAASGGTVFLDEISELPIDVQAKLLRVLQEREVVRVGDSRGIRIDVRLISASNRDLRAMFRVREFREDLYYRCNVIGINLPSLRDRPTDIPVLTNYFLAKYSRLLSREVFEFSDSALAKLYAYNWPGNVRELENAIERIVNLTEHQVVEVSDLPDELQSYEPSSSRSPAHNQVPRSLHEVEHEAIAAMLVHCAFNITLAARRLGISKPTLYSKIREYGISLERGQRPE